MSSPTLLPRLSQAASALLYRLGKQSLGWEGPPLSLLCPGKGSGQAGHRSRGSYLQAPVLLLEGLHRRHAAAMGVSCHQGGFLLHPALELSCHLFKVMDLMGCSQVLGEEGGPALG